jgi:hypothetical protein
MWKGNKFCKNVDAVAVVVVVVVVVVVSNCCALHIKKKLSDVER